MRRRRLPEVRTQRPPRVLAEGILSSQAREQHHAEEDQRDQFECDSRRSLAVQEPGNQSDEHDLRVDENHCEAGSDAIDGDVEERQVDREEQAGSKRQRPARDGPRVSLPHYPPQDEEYGYRVNRAIERHRHRSGAGQAHENRGERDCSHAGDGDESEPR